MMCLCDKTSILSPLVQMWEIQFWCVRNRHSNVHLTTFVHAIYTVHSDCMMGLDLRWLETYSEQKCSCSVYCATFNTIHYDIYSAIASTIVITLGLLLLHLQCQSLVLTLLLSVRTQYHNNHHVVLFFSSRRMSSVHSEPPLFFLSLCASCTCCLAFCSLSAWALFRLLVTVPWVWPCLPCSPGHSSATRANTTEWAVPLTKPRESYWNRWGLDSCRTTVPKFHM